MQTTNNILKARIDSRSDPSFCDQTVWALVSFFTHRSSMSFAKEQSHEKSHQENPSAAQASHPSLRKGRRVGRNAVQDGIRP